MIRPPKSLGETMILPVELGFESPYTNKAKRMRPLPGTVVYIHPEGRWFTLAFETPKGTFRESYCCVPQDRAFTQGTQHAGWRVQRQPRLPAEK